MSVVKPAVLLVDGYNIIGLSSELQQTVGEQNLAEARRELTEILANYSALYGYETELVFDSQYQQAVSQREKITDNLIVAYTNFGQTADSYIERFCALFFHEDIRRFQKRLIVATSDRAQWLTAVGYGAEWMSAQKLSREARLSASQVHHLQKRKKRSGDRLLSKTLGTKVTEQLTALRQELLQSGN